jgi:protein-disulfide isomerase
MRLNLPALTVGAMVCLLGSAGLAGAATTAAERSQSGGNFLTNLPAPSRNEAAAAKSAQPKYAAKNTQQPTAKGPAQPDKAAIEQAVREILTGNQGLLRAALVDLIRNDAELRKILAAPAERTETPQTPVGRPAEKPADQARVEAIVHNYLLQHPEVLQEAIAELEKRQAAAEAEKHQSAVKDNAAILFSSPRQVVLGNPQGDVTFVEFFDYNCSYCKRALSDMLDLIKTDPKLKVVLKEFPVLGQGSVEAAQVAVGVRMQDKTGKKYLEFHQKLLLGRGQADRARALAVAKEIGLDMTRLEKDIASAEARATIEESMKLAEALGLNGTPSYVVGSNVVIGAVGLPALREKVNTARCGKALC